MFERNGRFNSRDYDKFGRMELMESPVRDAIRELKTYSLETPAQRFDMCLLGAVSAFFCEVRRRRRQMVLLSIAYIPRALNNRDVNDAIVEMFFIGKWRVHKLSLWAKQEDIDHYGNDSNKAFYHLVNR